MIINKEAMFLYFVFLCFSYGFGQFLGMWPFYVLATIAGLYLVYCINVVAKSIRQKGWSATRAKIYDVLNAPD